MGTAVPLGTPVRGVTPSPPPCWAGVEQGGWCGAGVWGPPFPRRARCCHSLYFPQQQLSLAGLVRAFRGAWPPRGGTRLPPGFCRAVLPRGSLVSPQQLPTAGAFGRNGCPKGLGNLLLPGPSSPAGLPPPGRSVLGWQQEDVGDGAGVVPGAQSLGLICREGRTSMERGARGSPPCSQKAPTGGGVTVGGLGGRTPRDVLTEESLKRTRRHSSGQTACSSSGVICSSWWPDSTPRHLTVLGTDRQTVRGRGGLAQPGGVTPPRGGHALGTRGAAHIREKPLSFSQAVTSAGEEPMCRLGGLTWEGGQRERGWWGDPCTPPPGAVGVEEARGGPGGDPPGSSRPRAPAAPGCCWGRSPCAPCCSAPATTSSAGPAPRAGGDNVAAPPAPHRGGVPL